MAAAATASASSKFAAPSTTVPMSTRLSTGPSATASTSSNIAAPSETVTMSKRVSMAASATASTSSKFAAPFATVLPPTEFGALDLRRRKQVSKDCQCPRFAPVVNRMRKQVSTLRVPWSTLAIQLESWSRADGLLPNFCDIPGESIDSKAPHTFTEAGQRVGQNLSGHAFRGLRLKAGEPTLEKRVLNTVARRSHCLETGTAGPPTHEKKYEKAFPGLSLGSSEKVAFESGGCRGHVPLDTSWRGGGCWHCGIGAALKTMMGEVQGCLVRVTYLWTLVDFEGRRVGWSGVVGVMNLGHTSLRRGGRGAWTGSRTSGLGPALSGRVGGGDRHGSSDVHTNNQITPSCRKHLTITASSGQRALARGRGAKSEVTSAIPLGTIFSRSCTLGGDGRATCQLHKHRTSTHLADEATLGGYCSCEPSLMIAAIYVKTRTFSSSPFLPDDDGDAAWHGLHEAPEAIESQTRTDDISKNASQEGNSDRLHRFGKRKMKRREFSKKLLAQRDIYDVYKHYLRMDADTVRELLLLLALYPQQEDTRIRNRIPTEERLVANLRYLATSRSHECLRFSGGISPQSLATIISETRRHIYEVLREKYLKLSDRKYRSRTYSFILTLQIHKVLIEQGDLREKLAEGTLFLNKYSITSGNRWYFPNCEGALNGKHFRTVYPKRSGAQVYNHKHFYSKVLMGMVNSYYEFVYFDVGNYGRNSDGSSRYDHLNLPQGDQNVESLNFVLVADEVFGLHKHVMKPFNKAEPTYEAILIIDYQRREIILHSVIHIKPENIRHVVMTICVLYNILRRENQSYFTVRTVDSEDKRTHETARCHPLQMHPSGMLGKISSSQKVQYCAIHKQAFFPSHDSTASVWLAIGSAEFLCDHHNKCEVQWYKYWPDYLRRKRLEPVHLSPCCRRLRLLDVLAAAVPCTALSWPFLRGRPLADVPTASPASGPATNHALPYIEALFGVSPYCLLSTVCRDPWRPGSALSVLLGSRYRQVRACSDHSNSVTVCGISVKTGKLRAQFREVLRVPSLALIKAMMRCSIISPSHLKGSGSILIDGHCTVSHNAQHRLEQHPRRAHSV
ncbi:hypothetical protein PR048_030178 [Dryococelus australis]|uniref:DDE Tnp4 domain-containing protein n=1 Tax=Dryococelus australis TaxID=614101 RepID=A0ABQ9G875_9NEOP|nr:hypothetical protein PR048_030178 [Dryococelus australis]